MRRVQLSQVPVNRKVLGFPLGSRLTCPILDPQMTIRVPGSWLVPMGIWWVLRCSLPILSPTGLRGSHTWWAPVGWGWGYPRTPGTELAPLPCSVDTRPE